MDRASGLLKARKGRNRLQLTEVSLTLPQRSRRICRLSATRKALNVERPILDSSF